MRAIKRILEILVCFAFYSATQAQQINEYAIRNQGILARVADNETITGAWTFGTSGTRFLSVGIGGVVGANNTIKMYGTSSGSMTLSNVAAIGGDYTITFPKGSLNLSGTLEGTFLRAGASPFVPAWSAVTIPNSFTANGIFYASSTSAMANGTGLTWDGSLLTATGASATVIGGVVENTTSGTGAFAKLLVHGGSTFFTMYSISEGYTPSGAYIARYGVIDCSGLGVNILASNASNVGVIGMYAGNHMTPDLLIAASGAVTASSTLAVTTSLTTPTVYGSTTGSLSLISASGTGSNDAVHIRGGNAGATYIASFFGAGTYAGRVGIGTVTPGRILDVYGSAQFKDVSTIATTIWSEAVSGAGGIGTNSNHPFVLIANGTEQLRVSALGLTTITSTTQQLKLVNGATYADFTVGATGDLTIAASGGDTSVTGTLTATTGLTVTAGNITASAGYVDVAGSATTGINYVSSAHGFIATSGASASQAGYYIKKATVEKWAIFVGANVDTLSFNGVAGIAATLTSAGVFTAAGGLTVTAGGATITSGNLGVGVASSTNTGIYINGVSILASASQFGVMNDATYGTWNTGTIYGYYSRINTTTDFDAVNIYNYYAGSPNLGHANFDVTGNIIGFYVANQGVTDKTTNAYGVYIAAQSGAATTNIGLYNGGTSKLVGLVTADAGVTVSAGSLTVSAAGPHAFGGATDGSIGLYVRGTFAPQVSTGTGVLFQHTITGVVNGSHSEFEVNPTINKAASGTHAWFDGVLLDGLTIGADAGSTVTNASVFRIAAPPTGATNNYSMHITGNAYFTADVSALTFTDRTPYYQGQSALTDIAKFKSKNGHVDHDALPEFAKAYNDKGEVIGRNLGNTISILIEAVKELEAKIAKLEGRN